MPDNTIKERTARLRENNAKKGLVQVKVWIPEDKRETLRELATKWREEKAK